MKERISLPGHGHSNIALAFFIGYTLIQTAHPSNISDTQGGCHGI
jgi:hypothetical protein